MATSPGAGRRRVARLSLVTALAIAGAAVALALPTVAGAASLATPTIASFTPTNAAVGTKILINGSGFTGATTVKLGGMISTFTVLSDAQIRVSVPAKPPGFYRWTVTTPEGTATSATFFRVTASSCGGH